MRRRRTGRVRTREEGEDGGGYGGVDWKEKHGNGKQSHATCAIGKKKVFRLRPPLELRCLEAWATQRKAQRRTFGNLRRTGSTKPKRGLKITSNKIGPSAWWRPSAARPSRRSAR
eukprot:6275280-Pyramimonas_sp.AAC.1